MKEIILPNNKSLEKEWYNFLLPYNLHASFGCILRRALDNQVYVATASPARDETASYVAWGHSTVVNPWYSTVKYSVTSPAFKPWMYRRIISKMYQKYKEVLVFVMQKNVSVCLWIFWLVIVAICCCRGEVVSKAGPEEAVIYADIGECACFCRQYWSVTTTGLNSVVAT